MLSWIFGTWWHDVWKIGFYNSIELALFFSAFFIFSLFCM